MAGPPLAITFHALTRSANAAAADVLLLAIDSPHDAIRDQALAALLERRDQPYQLDLLARWETAGDRYRSLIAAHPGRLALALRQAVAGERPELFSAACEVILATGDYELAPALIGACERGAPHGAAAGATLLSLIDALHDAWLAGAGDDWKRDPSLVRSQVLFSLEKSLERFDAHRAKPPVEAFLMLAEADNEALRSLLSNPRRSAHRAVIEALTHSQRPGVRRLLLALFADPRAPAAAAHAMAHRDDEPFVRALLQAIGDDASPTARMHLKRMESIRWIERRPELLPVLPAAEQVAAVTMMAASGMPRLKALDGLRVVLNECHPAARRAASAALAEFQGVQANQLVLDHIHDADPIVQAHLVGQLRERGIAAALGLLLDRVDSPHPEVRQAAAEGLAEFRFARYLAAFDALAEDARRGTGALVRKIDPTAILGLREELASTSRTRKLRAMAIAPHLHATEELVAPLTRLLTDDDPAVRAAAAHLLADVRSAGPRSATQIPIVVESLGHVPTLRDTV